MPIYRLGDRSPIIHATAYVHPDAVLIGDVTVDAGASVWPSAVLRGDFGPVLVGECTLVEDGCVLHGTRDRTVIAAGVVLGHLTHAQGCTIGESVLVGSGAVVLDRSHVGPGSLIAAGAVVTPGMVVPAGSRVTGVPGVVEEGRGIRREVITAGLAEYGALARRYANSLVRIG